MDRDTTTPRVADHKVERLALTHEFRNYGPGQVPQLDVYFAIPSDLPNQRLLGDLVFEPEPLDIVTDRWGQRLAHFRRSDVPLAERVRHTMTVDVELASARWYIFPETVGGLDEIPSDIRQAQRHTSPGCTTPKTRSQLIGTLSAKTHFRSYTVASGRSV